MAQTDPVRRCPGSAPRWSALVRDGDNSWAGTAEFRPKRRPLSRGSNCLARPNRFGSVVSDSISLGERSRKAWQAATLGGTRGSHGAGPRASVGEEYMRPLIVGNWKMNGLAARLCEIEALSISVVASRPLAEVLICLPATLIEREAVSRQDALRLVGRIATRTGMARSRATSALRC